MTEIDQKFEEMLEDLKQKRDEIRVQLHLASKEVKEEWEELEEKMEEFSDKAKRFASDAKLKETGSGLGDALGKLGHELKLGYERLRDAIKD
jgi:chromosome segregation ATPase